MSMCPNCNKELSEGITVCDGCGTEIEQKAVSAPAVKISVFERSGVKPETKPEMKLEMKLDEEKEQQKKKIVLGGIAAAVIAAVVLLICIWIGGGNAGNNYAVYVKDSEMYLSDLENDDESWQLTDRLTDSDDFDDEELAEGGYTLGLYTTVSENGEYIFFPDRISDEDDGINLYYRETDSESEAIKIDSDVYRYIVNTSAEVVTYIKGEDRNLYQYDLGEGTKDKIGSEVSNFYVNDKADRIVYLNDEGSLYLKEKEEDKVKIATDVRNIQYVSKDRDTVYYLKDSDLYKWVEDEESVKIASDIYGVIKIYESGEIYYSSRETEKISLFDYVIDDMNTVDVGITKPEYPVYPHSPSNYPSRWDYETELEYEAACDAYVEEYKKWSDQCERMEEEYDAAMEAYWKKVARDDLRKELKDEKIENTRYTLYYYDGKETAVLTEDFANGDYDYTVASDAPVISYEAYIRKEISKVKLSEIESMYDIDEVIEDSGSSKKERYIAAKGNATLIVQEKEAKHFCINDSGTTVYYIDDIPNDKNYGALYRISVSKDSVGEAELYDEEVSTNYCRFMNDSDFLYYKDYKSGKGELYINKNKIDYDVYAYRVSRPDDSEKVIYFADWDDDKQYGTLKVYDGKESTKIADDVHDYMVTPGGEVLYLYDYSMNYYKGELHEWDDGDTRKIDEDVVCVLPMYTVNFGE